MLYTLPSMGFIAISGVDAAKFLQGQLTCNMAEIDQAHSRLGAYCSQQGRVQATFRIFNYREVYYLFLPKELIPSILETLQKYAIFSKVKLADASSELSAIGIEGDKDIDNLLQNEHFTIPTAIDELTQTDEYGLLRLPGILLRYLFIGHPDFIESFLVKKAGLTAKDENDWWLSDIALGIPTITAATQDLFTPHMLNFHLINGISFNKGCYIGQEIIARTHYRGQVKQQLYRACIKRYPLAPGDKISNQAQDSMGTVINCAKKGQDTFEILAVLQEQTLQTSKPYFKDVELEILPLQ